MQFKDELEIVFMAAPVLYAMWKLFVRPVITTVKTSAKTLELLLATQKTVEELKADMRPNGGSSIRDAIDRVERMVSYNHITQRAILDLLDAGFVVTDPDGECTYVNRYWYSITGISRDEARGRGWMRAIVPEDRERVEEEWFLAMRDGRTYSDRFTVQNIYTGQTHHIYCHSVALREVDDVVYGHIATLLEEEEG